MCGRLQRRKMGLGARWDLGEGSEIVKEFYLFAEAWLVPLQLVLAMFGMGATLSARDFAQIFRHPAGLALGLSLQLLMVPLLALLFIKGLDLSPGWAVGLLLLAAVPGGAASNLFTFLGRGNVPLSIAVTLSTTMLCMGTIPAILAVFATQFLPSAVEIPTGRIVLDILRYLLIPLSVGMLVFRYVPSHAERLSKWSIRGSLLLILTVAIAATGSGRIKMGEYGWEPPLIIVSFGLVLSVITAQICRLAKRFDDDTTALTIEVTVRNTGIGLLLVQFFFPGQPEQGHVLYSCLFYAGISGALMLPALLRNRAGKSPVWFRARYARPVLEGAAHVSDENESQENGFQENESGKPKEDASQEA